MVRRVWHKKGAEEWVDLIAIPITLIITQLSVRFYAVVAGIKSAQGSRLVIGRSEGQRDKYCKCSRHRRPSHLLI